MAFPVVKILLTIVVFLFFCGLQVDCKVEKYAVNIVENGTSFKEEVEVDVDNQTEVFRVPKHNNADAVEIMNDFIAALSVRRDSMKRVCYVSELDPSFSSPGKMKLDMDQASKQSSVSDVVTKSNAWKVVGFANRSALSEKILEFCGTFPIYEIKTEEIPLDILNSSLREVSGRVRSKRHQVKFQMCWHYDRLILEYCLRKVGHNNLHYKCKIEKNYVHITAKCYHSGSLGYKYNYNYKCSYFHYVDYIGICCTPSC